MSRSLKSAMGVALLAATTSLAGFGCGAEETPAPPTGGMSGAMEKEKMGDMAKDKMEGDMAKDKMGGDMAKDKMEGAPK